MRVKPLGGFGDGIVVWERCIPVISFWPILSRFHSLLFITPQGGDAGLGTVCVCLCVSAQLHLQSQWQQSHQPLPCCVCCCALLLSYVAAEPS